MKKRIYLSPPHLSGKEQEILQATLESNWIAPLGKNLDDFEAKIAQFTNSPQVLALNSGTSAIHLGLRLLNVQKNDIVLCPSLTFVASLNPILYLGAKPILIDSEPETWNICPRLLEKAVQDCLSQKQKPKAIMVVHLYGQSAKMQEILAISKTYQIPILEDSAEALGSSYQNQKLGTLGEIGVLSFNGNKIITTSAGGALLCKKKTQKEIALFWATQAKEKQIHYEHHEIGYNYRLSNVLAGIGIAQMQVLEERIEQRRKNFEFYKTNLSKIEGITFQTELSDTFSNRWLTCILLDKTKLKITPEKIRLALEAENIESRPIWKPMHLQKLCKDFPYYTEKDNATQIFEQGLCLPSGSSLTEDDLYSVVKVILECFE